MAKSNAAVDFLKSGYKSLTSSYSEKRILGNIMEDLTNAPGVRHAKRLKNAETPAISDIATKTTTPAGYKAGTSMDKTLGDHVMGVVDTAHNAAKDYFWRGARNANGVHAGLTTSQKVWRGGAGYMVGANAIRAAGGGSPISNSSGDFDIAGIPFI